jgi:hypothetical protein
LAFSDTSIETTTLNNAANVTDSTSIVDDDSTKQTDVIQAQRSPKSQKIEPPAKVDLGIFGSFWLEKPVQVGEVSGTERPSPVFRVEDYTDRYQV